MTLVGIFYSPILNHKFILLDDDIHIKNNHHPSQVWKEPHQGLYIPVTYSLWNFQKQNSDLVQPRSAKIFHLTSILLHGLNTILLFFILWEIFGNRPASLLGALLFGLHPIQVEAVAWISAQKDCLATFFALVALFFLIRSSKTQRKIETGFLIGTGTLAYVMGLLSKPSIVTFPVVIILLINAFAPAFRKMGIWICAFWSVLGLPFVYLTTLAQPSSALDFIPPILNQFLIASDAITFYLGKLLFPFQLVPDYSRTPERVLSSPLCLWTLFVPITIGFILWRRDKKIFCTYLAFLISIFPVLGFVPFYFQTFSTVADRYLYTSMALVAMAAAYLANQYSWKPRFWIGPLFICAFLTHQQIRPWKDSMHLFVHTLEINPRSLLAHNNLGTLLESWQRWDDALFHYRESQKLAPHSIPPKYNEARILIMQGQLGEADRILSFLLEKAPQIPDLHYLRAIVFKKLNRTKESEESLKRALELARSATPAI